MEAATMRLRIFLSSISTLELKLMTTSQCHLNCAFTRDIPAVLPLD
jgi:hypothetical protein